MKKTQRKKPLLISTIIVSFLSSTALAATNNKLTCKVNGSEDYFVIYEEQQTYSSDTFTHYQLIDGLTIIVVNKQTMQFNRLSNLNLLPYSTNDPQKPADKPQLFEGECIIPL